MLDPRNELEKIDRLSKRKEWRINLGKWSRFAPGDRISDPIKDNDPWWRDEDVNVKGTAIINASVPILAKYPSFSVKLEPPSP